MALKEICFPTDNDMSPSGHSNPAKGVFKAKEASTFEPLGVAIALPRKHKLQEEGYHPHRKQSEHTSKDYVIEGSLDHVTPGARHPQYSLRHQASIEKE